VFNPKWLGGDKMKIECEQGHERGYLQQLGNYFRVRHYQGIDKNSGKSKFYYHQQTPDYASTQIALNRKGENFIADSNNIGQIKAEYKEIEHLNTVQELNLKISSLNQQNIGGRRLAGLGHKPSKLAITGSNPVDRTNTVFFRAGGDNAL
jgi:hypothetical protein